MCVCMFIWMPPHTNGRTLLEDSGTSFFSSCLGAIHYSVSLLVCLYLYMCIYTCKCLYVCLYVCLHACYDTDALAPPTGKGGGRERVSYYVHELELFQLP